MEPGHVLVDLFVLFAAAKILGELFEYLKQPAVVGEVLGGVLVGPHVLGLLQPGSEAVLGLMAELGVIILLFGVGLETSVGDLRRVGRAALLVGVLGVAVPFAAAVALMGGLGYGRDEVLFVAAALVATSVGVTARVFRDLGAIRARFAQVVLAAAVVDDILAILVLAVVSALAATGQVSALALGGSIAAILAFVVVVTAAGPRVTRRISRIAHWPIIPGSPLVFALLLTLGLAALAETIGLAAIIGAFLAGLVLEFEPEEVATQVRPLEELLVPFFFAVTGSRLDPNVFADPAVLGLGAAVTFLAIATKIVGGALGARSLGGREALLVGVGMVPRGEVGLIVAAIGLGLGTVSPRLYGVVVAMTVVTTLATPPVLARMARRAQASD